MYFKEKIETDGGHILLEVSTGDHGDGRARLTIYFGDKPLATHMITREQMENLAAITHQLHGVMWPDGEE